MLRLRIVLALLCVLLVAVPVFAQDAEYTVNLSSNDMLGTFMVGANGMTLYTLARDPLDASACSGQCAQNWPALTVESADSLTADPAIPGEFGTITREDDGTTQVTYNGQPLYFWVRDAAPGDTTGQGFGGVWWVVAPATVAIANNPTLGPTLVGPTGMTVYTFANDEPGVSNCTGSCIGNWPPLTVESADGLVAGINVHGELGTITRDDGALQVTYNEIPLYYWQGDAARGDATGEGVGERWFTLAPETLAVSNKADLGDFLVAGAGGKTVYIFTDDEPGVSTCFDDCLAIWPAVTVGENVRLVGGAGIEGEIGTITRDDGALQLTYNGQPLYFWINDVAPGDTTGQGIAGVWFVVAP